MTEVVFCKCYVYRPAHIDVFYSLSVADGSGRKKSKLNKTGTGTRIGTRSIIENQQNLVLLITLLIGHIPDSR